MKKFLLDTHILIWADLEPRRISSRVRRIVENPSNELWLSPICNWEAARLVDDGEVRISMPFEEWFAAMVSDWRCWRRH
jgi:PIN domain nuclease of toxin-antitoxin system